LSRQCDFCGSTRDHRHPTFSIRLTGLFFKISLLLDQVLHVPISLPRGLLVPDFLHADALPVNQPVVSKHQRNILLLAKMNHINSTSTAEPDQHCRHCKFNMLTARLPYRKDPYGQLQCKDRLTFVSATSCIQSTNN